MDAVLDGMSDDAQLARKSFQGSIAALWVQWLCDRDANGGVFHCLGDAYDTAMEVAFLEPHIDQFRAFKEKPGLVFSIEFKSLGINETVAGDAERVRAVLQALAKRPPDPSLPQLQLVNLPLKQPSTTYEINNFCL